MAILLIPIVFSIYLLSGLKIVKEYERLIVFTSGKYTTILKPGLRFVWPIFQSTYKINLNKNIDELSIELKSLSIPAEIITELLNEIKKPKNSDRQSNESVRKD